MKIDILDVDRLIDVNKLQEVTYHKLFSNNMIFHPDGLLSNEIFGISKSDRRSTYGFIDLKRRFIHPHIYHKVLKSIFRGIIYIVSGQRKYSIRDGLPVEDPNGWTGLDQLYNHWDEIDWKKHQSVNKTNKQLLLSLPKERIFLTKIAVMPPAYRDVMISGTIDSSDHVNELNELYQTLIRGVSMLNEGGLFARTQFSTQARIQDSLVNIYLYCQNMISRKNGLIRKNLIGKSVDYGVRSVITAMSYRHDRFTDSMIDVQHSAVPINQCCSAFYPFIQSWVKNFFMREVISDPNLFTFYDPETKQEFTAQFKNPEMQFSDRNIRKMINDFCLNPDNRFKIIKLELLVPNKKGNATRTGYMMLKGKKIMNNDLPKDLHRPMTVADILYLACVECCEKRHIMVSRYPVGTDKGIYFNRVRVRSTVNTIKLVLNGKEYPYYPDIDLNIDPSKVGVQFIDSLSYSNSHLDGMGETSSALM